MLDHCKISQYKIKKILKYFVEDYTSTETSKHVKLSRNTIDRYYILFRKAIRDLLVNMVRENPMYYQNYIGCIKGLYGPKTYLKAYKINERFFLLSKLIDKSDYEKNAMLDKDFKKFVNYVRNRFAKFHGVAESVYYYQLTESSFKYAYEKNELFKMIWKQLIKSDKK